MIELSKISSALFGDHRYYTLEHRLFNIVSLLNAIANFGGSIAALGGANYLFLFALHLTTGILFLAYYYFSRFRGAYRRLYWAFVFTIAVFLFLNTTMNAGSLGGAHYYLIPALVIAVILSRGMRTTIAATLLFLATAAGLLLMEWIHPEWISSYTSSSERFVDVFGNFLFVQILTGGLVIVLAKTLNQERAKSDSLLLNVLPASVADELKSNQAVRPRYYESATVLFTDFVGFTQTAERMTPDELVRELDVCFSRFDAISRKHNLEKIKTIGDAYMAVGGVPTVNQSHAIDSVLAALEMQQFMSELAETKKAENRPCWRVRLGIHTGPLVAGVVGREKFAYDVWGDTVNTASRLESSGTAGRVNISRATYELVKLSFECEYRGQIPAKNKGEIGMYFVIGIRPSQPQHS